MKARGKKASMSAGVVIGIGVSVASTLALSALTAKLVDAGTVKEELIDACALAITFLSAWMGAGTGYLYTRERRAEVSLISCGLYLLLLLGITALAFGGMYAGVWKSLLLIALAGLIATLPALRKGRGVKRKRIRR